MKKYQLKDRVIVITGSTGGLGQAAAQALHAKGAKLALLDLDLDTVKAQANALDSNDVVKGWAADVCSLENLENALAQVAQHFGKIDVVIANAGIGKPEAMQYIDPKTFERTIDINLVGVFRTFRAALPYVTTSRGYLLAVSSMAAFVHSPLNTHYTASKAGVWALCNSLRLELKHLGIGVGSLHPTFFQTPMMDAVQTDPAANALWKGNTGIWKYVPIEDVVAGLVNAIEQRRDMVIVPKANTLVARAPGLFRNLIELIGFSRKGLAQTMQIAKKQQG